MAIIFVKFNGNEFRAVLQVNRMKEQDEKIIEGDRERRNKINENLLLSNISVSCIALFALCPNKLKSTCAVDLLAP